MKVHYRDLIIKETLARDRVGGAETVTRREGCCLVDIEHFALNVPDPVAAAAWYARHLGMRVVRSLGEAPFTHFLADRSHRVVVEMYGHTKAPVPDYGAMDPLVFHIAFVTADVRAARERLLAAGASSAGDLTTTPAGDEMMFLRDPWGVPLQLVKRAVSLTGLTER